MFSNEETVYQYSLYKAVLMIKENLEQVSLMYVVWELRSSFFMYIKYLLECNCCNKSETPKSRNLDIDIMDDTQTISKVVPGLHKVISVWWLNIILTHKMDTILTFTFFLVQDVICICITTLKANFKTALEKAHMYYACV